MKPGLTSIVEDARACQICKSRLPLGPRPVFQVDEGARILIAGHAPGLKVHESGVPFDDPSGERLRDWMGVDKAIFYDAAKIAILPMGFCYPGRGKSGDLPPRPECAPEWRQKMLDELPDLALTLVIGQYAQRWHFGKDGYGSLTERLIDWRNGSDTEIALPHPSPRNNIWLKRNPWFAEHLVPHVRTRVASVLK